MNPPAWIEKTFVAASTAFRWSGLFKRAIRQRLSHRYIAGDGIEIGALNGPLGVGPKAHVRYVDRVSRDINIALYPGIPPDRFVGTDIYDDGETLEKVADGSLDFIIANHFLEHARNPLGTLATHLRKLRSGGILYYTIPDKRFTFDRDRPVTSFEHVLKDYLDPDPADDDAHYLDYARHVDGKRGGDTAAHAALLKQADNRIHFHAWDKDAILRMFREARGHVGDAYSIMAAASVSNEVMMILRKKAAGGDAGRVGRRF